MKLENGHISGRALMFSVFCFMQGTMLRSAFIVAVTRNDSWVMALSGLLFSLPLVAIYVALIRRFEQKSLFEINELVFGPVLGRVFSLLYLFFFLTLAALNTHDLGDFVIGYMMPETPLPAVILLFVIVCVYAIRKGIQNMVRLSTALCAVSIGAIVINTVLVLKDIELSFLKPFFQLPLEKYIQATATVTAIPMGEIVAFTMITPMLSKDEKPGKMMASGLALSAALLMIILLRDIATMGPLLSLIRLPSFESIRYISLAGVLTRMESLYAIILISLFLFKVVMLLYASVLGLAQLMNFKSYSPLTLICGGFIFFYSLIVYKSLMENSDWGATTAVFFSLTFEFLLPVITLAVASLKKTAKPKAVEG
ncbi:MAG: endospore germination permease [Oscillospiraceae bacterium]|nr:endospore germination permease [Oscillospiraceae bacterium]